MEAYSLDLRERIIAACELGGDTRQDIADNFGVSRSFIFKLLQRWRETDSLDARDRGRGPSPLLVGAQLAAVRRALACRPDATLAELCAELTSRGGPLVSRSTMCRALDALGMPLKKRRFTPPSETRRVFGRCGAGFCTA